MRTLFLVRHAKSSWGNPILRDFDRPLNERGLADAPFMADFLKKRGIKPDLLVSSPAKRALTTSQFFAKAFGIAEKDIVQKEEIYEANELTIHKIIHQLPDTCQTVLIFGHNMTFTDIANHFSTDYIENVPTCGIVQIETDSDFWAGLSEFNSRVVACFFPKNL